MKKQVFFAVAVLVVASLACSIDFGNQPQVPIQEPQQPAQAQEPQILVITATPAPATFTPLPTYTPYPTYTPLPPAVVQNPTATAKSSLDCMPYPSFDATLLDGIPKGRTVDIVGKTSQNSLWYQVKWSNYICWVYSEFVVVTGDTSKVPDVTVVIPKKEEMVGMRVTVTNNSPFKLCRMELHALGGGTLWWYEPGKGNWDPGETATLTFNLKKGFYDVYIYTCKGELVDLTPNFFIEDGGDYVTP